MILKYFPKQTVDSEHNMPILVNTRKETRMTIEEGKYTAIEISRYVINWFYDINDFDNTVSNLKLQKLLYYIQARFIVKKHEKCFNEPILAWPFGPVVRSAYDEFKFYGNLTIPEIKTVIDYDGTIDSLMGKPYKTSISTEDQILIIEELKTHGMESAIELMQATHKETPWIQTFNNGAGQGNEITPQVIYDYFKDKIA